MKKNAAALLLLLIFTIPVFSDATDDSGDSKKLGNESDYFMQFRGDVSLGFGYYPTDDNRINPNPAGGVEAKIFVKYNFIAPFLTAPNSLMEGNNIKFSLYGEISPVSFSAGMGVTLTPVAFLTFEAGFLVGFGWKALSVGGAGINNNGTIEKFNFFGPSIQVWFKPTFQFDLAAIMPLQYQRWTHIVMTFSSIFKYQALEGLSENQPFMWEENRGDSLNGWRLMTEAIVGYQFIMIEDRQKNQGQFVKLRNNRLNLILGIYSAIDYVDLSNYNLSTMSNNGWGSDFCFVEFGPVARMELPHNFSLMLFCFWKNDRKATSATENNLYYQDRVINDWEVYFRRFGFMFGWTF